METYFAVCAGLCTICMVATTVIQIGVLLQVKKAADKISHLTDKVDARFQAVCDAADRITGFFTGGWMRGAQSAFSVISAIKNRFAGRRAESAAI